MAIDKITGWLDKVGIRVKNSRINEWWAEDANEVKAVVNNNADELEYHINANNPHSIDASAVGLGNVDNTSDADKPVSTDQQEEIDTKLGKGTYTGGNAQSIVDLIPQNTSDLTNNGSDGNSNYVELDEINASNGLSINVTSGDIELGGSITKPTSIDISGTDTLTFNATMAGSVNEMRFSNSDFNVNFGDGSPFSDSTNLEVSSNRVSFRRGDTGVLIEGLDLRINPQNSTSDNSQNGYVLSKKDNQGGTEWIPSSTGYTGSYTVNGGGTTITVLNGLITSVTS